MSRGLGDVYKRQLYMSLRRDISRYLVRTIVGMKRRGEIRDDSFWTILRRFKEEL